MIGWDVPYKWRCCPWRLCFNLSEWFIVHAQCYMLLIHQLFLSVLPQNDAGHMVSLINIPTYNKIIIYQMLHLQPGLRPLSLEVQTVLLLGNNPL